MSNVIDEFEVQGPRSMLAAVYEAGGGGRIGGDWRSDADPEHIRLLAAVRGAVTGRSTGEELASMLAAEMNAAAFDPATMAYVTASAPLVAHVPAVPDAAVTIAPAVAGPPVVAGADPVEPIRSADIAAIDPRAIYAARRSKTTGLPEAPETFLQANGAIDVGAVYAWRRQQVAAHGYAEAMGFAVGAPSFVREDGSLNASAMIEFRARQVAARAGRRIAAGMPSVTTEADSGQIDPAAIYEHRALAMAVHAYQMPASARVLNDGAADTEGEAPEALSAAEIYRSRARAMGR
jgi:hypothetical protein